MPIPIEIKRSNSPHQYFQINWMLHDRCTYSCSYCPPTNHKGKDNWLKIDKVISTCDQIESQVPDSLKMQILFGGGEPTVWKDFSKLAEHLYKKKWSMHIVTNLSRSVDWWKSLKVRWDALSASLHPEFANENDFIEKCQLVSNLTDSLAVRVMLHPDQKLFNRAIEIANRVKEECPFASIRWIPILYEFGGVDIPLSPYNDEQQATINKLLELPFLKTGKGNSKVIVWQNKVEQTFDPNKLVSNGLNRFNNWTCYAGIDGIFINSQGTILRGTCREGGELGNILDDTFILPKDPITCKRRSCTCVTDVLYSKKWLPDVGSNHGPTD